MYGHQRRVLQTYSSVESVAMVVDATPQEYPHMSEPILWMALGALAVQAALFYAKELLPVHFWALTVFNWACLFALPYAIHTAYL